MVHQHSDARIEGETQQLQGDQTSSVLFNWSLDRHKIIIRIEAGPVSMRFKSVGSRRRYGCEIDRFFHPPKRHRRFRIQLRPIQGVFRSGFQPTVQSTQRIWRVRDEGLSKKLEITTKSCFFAVKVEGFSGNRKKLNVFQMHVLNVMTLMVERVGQTIKPHTDALIHYLPLLWTESEDHNMLRCAIVSTLVQLVKALGSVSSELNPFLIPIIQLGTDTNQSAVVYLLEDCLELWLTVLENSTSMSNQLLQLFNNMPALLGHYFTDFIYFYQLCAQLSLFATYRVESRALRPAGCKVSRGLFGG